MAGYGDVLCVLRDFRNDLEQQAQEEVGKHFKMGGGVMSAFAARGGARRSRHRCRTSMRPVSVFGSSKGGSFRTSS